MLAYQRRREERKTKERVIANQAFSWDQNPGESDKAFKLFVLYLGIGKTRNYIKVCNLADSMVYQTICQYANKYNWKARSNDYDLAKDEEMMIKLDEEILYNRLRQLNIGKKLQDLADRGSDMLMDNIEELSPADIAKLADTGTKLTNLALGSSTEITESNVKSEVKIQVEEIPKELAEKIGKELAMAASEKMEINV